MIGFFRRLFRREPPRPLWVRVVASQIANISK